MDVVFFELHAENKPGTLGEVAGCLHSAGVNIEAFLAGHEGLRVLTDDPDKARACFKESSIGFTEEQVIEIRLENKPGQLAQVAKALGDHEVNIVTSFGAAGGADGGSIYIGVDQVDKAWAALESISSE